MSEKLQGVKLPSIADGVLHGPYPDDGTSWSQVEGLEAAIELAIQEHAIDEAAQQALIDGLQQWENEARRQSERTPMQRLEARIDNLRDQANEARMYAAIYAGSCLFSGGCGAVAAFTYHGTLAVICGAISAASAGGAVHQSLESISVSQEKAALLAEYYRRDAETYSMAVQPEQGQ